MRHDIFFDFTEFLIRTQNLWYVMNQDGPRDNTGFYLLNFGKGIELLLYLLFKCRIADEIFAAQAHTARQVRGNFNRTDEQVQLAGRNLQASDKTQDTSS